MIKLFRKIRQKLLSENKISNYFLYAITFDNTLVQNLAHRVEHGIESLILEIENELATKKDM